MSEYFWPTGSQERAEQESGFRGYDPLREIEQWQIILGISWMGIILVGYISSLRMDNTSFLGSWNFAILTAIILLSIVTLIFVFLWLLWSYRREIRHRMALRRAGLALQNLPQHPILPVQAYKSTLPCWIESRYQKGLALLITAAGCFVAGIILINYIIYNHLWGITYDIPGPLSMGIVYIGGGISWVIQSRVLKYYLLPSLQVDDEGIIARYGRDTISIRWSDIRYFALTSTITHARKRTLQHRKYEAFEISDGENMICWQPTTPSRFYPLFENGERRLSPDEYILFTQQLAAQIVERTGLPLYDFRPPEKQMKEKKGRKNRL